MISSYFDTREQHLKELRTLTANICEPLHTQAPFGAFCELVTFTYVLATFHIHTHPILSGIYRPRSIHQHHQTRQNLPLRVTTREIPLDRIRMPHQPGIRILRLLLLDREPKHNPIRPGGILRRPQLVRLRQDGELAQICQRIPVRSVEPKPGRRGHGIVVVTVWVGADAGTCSLS